MKHEFDIVIFGATSFVAKVVIEHFMTHYGVNKSVKWAIAGRNLQALEKIKNSLGQAAQSLSIIVADANDLPALKAMCSRCKVVLTMAGPYARYGEQLVRACAETGTDYADLTGESPWVADMIRRYEATAKQTGARIIHCCGFDSVPSDMGVYFLQQQSLKRFGLSAVDVKYRLVKAIGNAPGGTYATMMDTIKLSTEDAQYRADLFNPYLLCPDSAQFSQPQSKAMLPSYDPDLKQWTAFWIMGLINTKIVHRTNALLNKQYGQQFSYEEKLAVGKSIVGGVGSLVVSGAFLGFFGAAALPPTRYVMNKFLIPKPSQGGNLKRIKNYGYVISIHGKTAQNQQLEVRVIGKGDPAVYSTARMIAEAGMTLVMDLDQHEKVGGFWTPAALLGEQYINRLQLNGQMRFEVHHSS